MVQSTRSNANSPRLVESVESLKVPKLELLSSKDQRILFELVKIRITRFRIRVTVPICKEQLFQSSVKGLKAYRSWLAETIFVTGIPPSCKNTCNLNLGLLGN